MGTYVLRVEGVNFDHCLFDTNNLAVIRGASLLLDQVAVPVGEALKQALKQKIEPEWSGGSKAVFRFDATPTDAQKAEAAVRAALATGAWQHLTWVIDRVEGDELRAEARNRTRQFRQWTVAPVAVSGAWRQDALDGVRPADPDCTDPKGPLSPSTRARRAYGRAQRSGFWRQRMGAALPDGTVFCEDFQDIVARTPAPLSESAASKIAVLHFDGDGFGKLAQASGGSAAFARAYAPISQNLLAALVNEAFRLERAEGNDPANRLRTEVLVWGGDDMTLVVPGWRALDMIAAFHEAAKSARIAGQPLGFTGSAIIAPHTAPIRRLKALAEEAVGLTKDGARGGFTLDIFESASPPEDGLEAHRARVYPGVATTALAFAGSQAGSLAKVVRRYQSEAGRTSPSRSALHRMLREAADEAGLSAALARHEERVLSATRGGAEGGLRLPGVDRPTALSMRLLLELWDYVPPSGTMA